MKKIFFLLTGLTIILISLSACGEAAAKRAKSGGFTFKNPRKSAHYESNAPAHGSILPAQPIYVVIDFNFDLAEGSSISLINNKKEYGTRKTIIDTNKLAMRRMVNPLAPNGLYSVIYKACWPDGSCHDGRFEFAIDRKQISSAIDLRGKKEMTIPMAKIAFTPKIVRISKGTKIIWRNDDAVEHYVNTDSHPSHTYYPVQNSRLLKKGDVYSLTFDQAGVYPYHCSAHASVMTGTIVVE